MKVLCTSCQGIGYGAIELYSTYMPIINVSCDPIQLFYQVQALQMGYIDTKFN